MAPSCSTCRSLVFTRPLCVYAARCRTGALPRIPRRPRATPRTPAALTVPTPRRWRWPCTCCCDRNTGLPPTPTARRHLLLLAWTAFSTKPYVFATPCWIARGLYIPSRGTRARGPLSQGAEDASGRRRHLLTFCWHFLFLVVFAPRQMLLHTSRHSNHVVGNVLHGLFLCLLDRLVLVPPGLSVVGRGSQGAFSQLLHARGAAMLPLVLTTKTSSSCLQKISNLAELAVDAAKACSLTRLLPLTQTSGTAVQPGYVHTPTQDARPLPALHDALCIQSRRGVLANCPSC